MKLISLELTNFKGIKFFTLPADGKNVTIYGNNAAGKTTIADAVSWLLFSKDSQFKSQFEIKTLGPDGEAKHMLDHVVEGSFLLDDGTAITLKKVYSETWEKKRSSKLESFTGHTTKHFIDGVPKPKKDFDLQIATIADEEIFKLLTSPSYFAEKLKWQDRRQLLLKICGDVSDTDVIASDKILADLPGILNGRKLDDHKKVIAERRKELDEFLGKGKKKGSIQIRIDEVNQGQPDIKGLDKEALTKNMSSLHDQIQRKNEEYVRIESGGEVAEKTKSLAETETELIRLRNQHNESSLTAVKEKQSQLDKLEDDRRGTIRTLADIELDVETKQKAIYGHEHTMAGLRKDWNTTNDEEFVYKQEKICPTCGQDIPSSQLEDALSKAIATFNVDKSENLEKINTEGIRLRKLVEGLTEEIGRQNAKAVDMNKHLANITSDIETIQAEIDAEKTPSTMEGLNAFYAIPGYKQLVNSKEEFEKNIADLKENSAAELTKVKSEVDRLNEELKVVRADLEKITNRSNGEKRIAELNAEHGKLAKEYENLERELYLMEEFTRAKVGMLEGKINNKFKLARFRLFQNLINEGLKECCDVVYDGVPYSGGLNNGARINVGLDIINTLSESYGQDMPIFVDNAESITELLPIKAQLIRLVVSKEDKKLRVEVE